VVAFEIEPAARRAAEELAQLNGVETRVELRGHRRPDDLASLTAEGVSLIVCDCEGNEAVLLDPAAVPGLVRSYILVETHDFVIRGITYDLSRRFKLTR